VDLCFYRDDADRTLWPHLGLIYEIGTIYEVGCPEDEQTDTWRAIASVDDLVGRRAIFCPLSSPTTPGVVSVREMAPADVLVFGQNNMHNTWNAREGDQFVYIATPGTTPFYAVQAAAIALYELNRADHG
jgi:hypothetical protein